MTPGLRIIPIPQTEDGMDQKLSYSKLQANLLPPRPRFHGIARVESGWWCITSFAAAKTLLAGPHVRQPMRYDFTHANKSTGAQSVLDRGKYLWSLCSNACDPPQHGRFQSAFASRLSPTAIYKAEPTMRRRAAALLASLTERRSADLVANYINPFIRQTFLCLIGIDAANHDRISKQSETLLLLVDPSTSLAHKDRCAFTSAALGDELTALLRTSLPDDASLGLSVQSAVRSGILSEAEAVGQLLELIFAGMNTVSQALAGLFARLTFHEEVWSKFGANLLPTERILEEGIRLGPPHQILYRVAAEDFDIDGKRIQCGERLSIDISYANLDPLRFTDPDTFNPERKAGSHLAFGQGLHRCVGMHLARLEMKVALETLLRFFPILPPPLSLEFGPGFHNRPIIKTLIIDVPSAQH